MDEAVKRDGEPSARGKGSILARENTLAGPRFNRWLVPTAALAIHLCIGMAYGFSVFWLPMTKLVAEANPAVCAQLSFFDQLFATGCNWTVPAVNHIFETFIAMLGISAAIWGAWLEHAGPRKAGFIAALCWGGGLIIGGIGVAIHQLWLVYLGAGVLGGIGQGLGYITPVSTLIKWFPDRRGLATGFAIMGYGGGALIGAPIAVALMQKFAHDGVPGVSTTLIVMGALYLVVMTLGAFGFRVPPSGWRPRDWTPPAAATNKLITHRHVHLNRAWKTPQFWLIWVVLCMNVTAGIGVLSMASPMFQDVFGGKLLGLDASVDLSAEQKAAIAASAAGLVGLISLFNSLGRIFWASMSDFLGRKTTYVVFFALGIALYCALPSLGHAGMAGLFVLAVCVILSMYGGGFATVPAYLSDLFGTQMVGAIHGRLLTAWSVAGVAGPFLIAAVRQAQLDAGVAKNLVYDRTLYILAVLLLVGMICNLLVKPVKESDLMTDAELAHEKSLQHENAAVAASAEDAARGSFGIVGVVAWALVGIPFLIGIWIAIGKAAVLF
ncbi:OFA family MFS transporter [Luteibacter aegosomaticola]|uniref:OFA family MFS transporter n=1 Tax=Luteibacter aegosomaticola TaxID=2911538 RepID=UPI001FF7A352|nr:OFA family MFS transporter [Luteibacter aegosomaticola]UPG89429.1 OFA family MFS transporter [Luteibacter aegosomaticola]